MRGQRDAELYPSWVSKLYSRLLQRAITTYLRVTWIVIEIVQETVSPSRWRCRGKLYGVCLRTRDPRIRQGKPSFGRWGKIGVAANWTISISVVRKDAHPWEEGASGKRPSWKDRFQLSSCSWDKDYLSVWRTLYNWNLRFITDPRPAKHILWRCVDIW